jgi:hypothetical protein
MAAVTFGAHGPIFFQLVCTVCTQTVCTACSHTCLHLHPPITHCLHCHGLLPGAVRVQRGCTFHKSLVSGYVCFLRMGPTHVAQVCLEPVLLLLGLQEWTSMPCRKLTFWELVQSGCRRKPKPVWFFMTHSVNDGLHCPPGDWTQGLAQAKHILYHWPHFL